MTTATKNPKTRSTVYIEDGLWLAVKRLALDEGTTATALVKEALKHLVNHRKETKR